MSCERVMRLAAGLAALDPSDPERVRALAHARGCPRCAAALREGERLLALLEAAPPARLSAGALRRAAEPVLSELPPVRPRVLLPVATLLVGAVVALSARSPSDAPADVVAALALAGAAAFLASLAGRRLVSAAAVVVALAFALAGGPGPLEPAEGVKCIATVLAAGALPLVAAIALSRGRAGAGVLGAAAAAGALSGMAGLEIGCHALATTSHLLVFHAGGVVAAAGLGALVGAWALPRLAEGR